MGKYQRSLCFYIVFTGDRLKNLLLDNIMGLIVRKQKCACGSSLLKLFGSRFPRR